MRRQKRALSFFLTMACILGAWAVSFWAKPALADPSQICDRAVQVVSRETGVPLDVLQAITLTETGRTRGGETRPWPWTVNMEGKGVWFETEDHARTYVFEHFKRGARSFDVGCFQINYKWHHEAFASIDEMFDPLASGRYAARFLLELFAEKGDWAEAAGAYHSRTPEHAERYMDIFDGHRAVLTAAGPMQADPQATPETIMSMSAPAPIAPPPPPRVNTFPLLQPGSGNRAAGSLVPIGTTNTSRMIDFNGTG